MPDQRAVSPYRAHPVQRHGDNLRVQLAGPVEVAADVTPAYQSSASQRWTGNTSTTMSWNLYTVRLAAYVGQVVDIRFAFMSDSSVVYDGWYIDDVIVTEQAP